MKLRTLLVLSLLTVLIVMAIPAVYGVNRVRDVRRIALELREQSAQSSLTVGRLQAGLARLDRYQRGFVATGNPELGRLTLGTVRQLELHLERLGGWGYSDVALGVGFPMDSLRALAGGLGAMMDEGRLDDATSRLAGDAQPLLARAEAAAAAIAAAIDRETARQIERADQLTAAAVTTTTVALILAVIAALGLALVAARLLTRPLDRLSGSMATVADGHFDAPADLPYDRDDEVGELSRSFRAMTLRLADLDRLKAEFVGVASHDLKTPISIITGYAEILEEELGHTLGRRHRDVIEALSAQARTLGRRLDQLLEISRMEASGLHLGLEEINLRHFIASLEKAHATTAARHRVALSTAVADSTPSFLIADPDCLQVEVLGNLLENAFRFTPAGGRVHLHVSGDGDAVVFEVRDTGRPIPSKDLRYVFDRYYQGKGLGRAGSGLGLPIARAGARAHGGEIEVESGNGQTIFHLTLPIHPAHAPRLQNV